ncbi:uncharacterized protein LOC113210770 isoform X1 [Frankliniella occidentalis]|uniref:Uncharacterized protein LOC113210770 isoform X1 n=1 Tax=Frankliniella occidentalis TaxID=133901 RepID=A0A6J1STU5_FRAOC|nr:uncharacterized protein LOC113210770 isoform X1 [Frankliniella occidentalis]
MYLTWALVVETKKNVSEGLPHVFVNFLLSFAVAVPTICCLRLRTFASGLLSALRQDLANPDLTPERVLKYRRTWTHLTNLSSGFIVTPVSMLLVTVLLVILSTLHSYETVERLTAGEAQVGCMIWLIGVPFLFLLFVLCEIPHRSADVIRRRFMNVLQMSYCRYRDDRSYHELHRFLEIIWWNSPVMTISGYFELQRSSFKAVCAYDPNQVKTHCLVLIHSCSFQIVTVIVTYVIVILQFHLSINNSAELTRWNGTQAMLSVNESVTATVTNKHKT